MVRRRAFLTLAAALLFSLTGLAKESVLSSYYVETEDRALLRTLFERFDLERRHGKGYEVIVPRENAGELLKVVPSARLLERDIRDVFRRLDAEDPGWRSRYHNFDSVQAELEDVVQKYPRLAFLENYGVSQEGRPLRVLRLTAPTLSEKPEILITASTHGDELNTVELAMALIQKLAAGYGTEARITEMLDRHVVYVIPVLCPDGYVRHSRYTNGVDPNRNYPWPGDPDKQSNPALVAEMAWVARHTIVGSLDIHENLATVMYPWAYTSQRPPAEDVARFQAITRTMAQVTGYNHGQIHAVFGTARGSSADFWYWKHHALALGYEMGGRFDPSTRDTYAYDRDIEAVFRFIESF